jgi:prefoldin beta subunit
MSLEVISLGQEIPPQLQQELVMREQIRQKLIELFERRQQFEILLRETEAALSELEKLDSSIPVYKSVGPLLIKSDKDKIKQELGERKDTLDIQSKTLAKQEERTRKQLEEKDAKLQQELKNRGILGGTSGTM